ncbi:MAG TPA: 3-oxoacyl-ACP reductase family protein [Polyangiaceae bacterium]|jgi:3-oxoacyl-[acyl-carrier protein] reductase|nr:3-oxoacyl-ACP reductase family protein [Polyangiaceae bacterium]
MKDLSEQVALVTGASRGIGREVALALAHAGASVAVGYHQNLERAEEVVEAIVRLGGKARAFGADVSDPEAAANLVRSAESELGPLAILVNNAGINHSKPLGELTPSDFDQTVRVNLSSAFYVTQAALPGMRARNFGRVVMLSSSAAQTGGVIGPHYAASKAGLLGLMHSYASLLVKSGITVNAIAPALIETDMIKDNDAITPDLIPLGRFGRPSEVAAVVLMLATNGYITGQTINVNGGFYLS